MNTETPAEAQQHIAYIGMGSNLGDGKAILLGAWQRLGECDGIELETLSCPYLTEPVGMDSSNWFTNAVGCLKTSLSPLFVLQQLMAVEAEFGRVREPGRIGYQDRSLDLDLLYHGKTVMDSPELTLPHPRITERLFVLVPLDEIAAGFCDPRSGQEVSRSLELLRSTLQAAGEQEIVRSQWEPRK